MKPNAITVQTSIEKPIEQVWDCFTQAQHITQWNFAHPSWHCPKASIDLREGGAFSYRMEARDGSAGFDLNGKFTAIEHPFTLKYNLEDGRQVEIHLTHASGITNVVEQFEPESQNSMDLQRQGWQAILNQFATHCMSQNTP